MLTAAVRAAHAVAITAAATAAREGYCATRARLHVCMCLGV